MKTGVKRWTQLFKAFANPSRVEIIRILAKHEKLAVGDIADKLDISFNATSRNLLILDGIDVAESKGKNNHVYYRLNPEMPADARAIVSFITKN